MTVVVAVVAALVAGCDVMNFGRDNVSDPLTPEQSRARVVDGARDIVRILDLDVVSATFWRSSCNGQHEAPFRGIVSISYPLAPNFEQSDAEVAKMVEQLQNTGWAGDEEFRSHGTTVKKNNVVAVFAPQSVSDKYRDLRLYGECRDMTTTKDTAGTTEDVNVG